MQPATIRRLLVFGVCLVGVGCLYLVPSMAGSGLRVGSTPAGHDRPTAEPTTASLVSATTFSPTVQTTESSPASTDRTTTGRRGATSDTRRPPGSASSTRVGATAVEPGRDDVAPGPVGPPSVVTADHERLTLSWPEAEDDVGVVSYTVRLNGFPVLTTQQTRATVTWFNDTNSHVIQVRAQDAAGNVGPASPTLLVTRPAPAAPTSTPALSPSTPTPTKKPAPSPTPTQEADDTPDVNSAPSPTQTGESGAEGSNS